MPSTQLSIEPPVHLSPRPPFPATLTASKLQRYQERLAPFFNHTLQSMFEACQTQFENLCRTHEPIRILMPGAGTAPGLLTLLKKLKQHYPHTKFHLVLLDNWYNPNVQNSSVATYIQTALTPVQHYVTYRLIRSPTELTEQEKFEVIFCEHPTPTVVQNFFASATENYRDMLVNCCRYIAPNALILTCTYHKAELQATKNILGSVFPAIKHTIGGPSTLAYCSHAAKYLKVQFAYNWMGISCVTELPSNFLQHVTQVQEHMNIHDFFAKCFIVASFIVVLISSPKDWQALSLATVGNGLTKIIIFLLQLLLPQDITLNDLILHALALQVQLCLAFLLS